MLRIKDIQKGLLHLVGWEQAEDDGRRILDFLTASESGLTFQQAHPLLTLDNIRSILPTPAQYDEWESGRTYASGEKCSYEGIIYICIADGGTANPPTTEGWRVYDQLSEYLLKLTNEGIARVAAKMTEDKTLNRSSKQLFERKTLFDVAGRTDNRVPNYGCLVGYEIQPLRGIGVTTQIHRIGLQFRTGTTVGEFPLTIYIFHSSTPQPIYTRVVTANPNGRYIWSEVADVYLPYVGKETASGGAWYVCYNQNDLPDGVEAVNISRDWSREPCMTCNVGDVKAWRTMTKYIRVSPFRVAVAADFSDNPACPMEKSVDYTKDTCYGMNLDLSIGCDVSDFIISQRSMFATVLQKEVAVNALRRIMYNPNVNVNRNQMNAALQVDIEGSTYQKSRGLAEELAKAYKALDLDTRGLDSACLACTRRGVIYRGV